MVSFQQQRRWRNKSWVNISPNLVNISFFHRQRCLKQTHHKSAPIFQVAECIYVIVLLSKNSVGDSFVVWVCTKKRGLHRMGPKVWPSMCQWLEKRQKKESDVQNYLLLITFWAHKTRFFTKGRTLGWVTSLQGWWLPRVQSFMKNRVIFILKKSWVLSAHQHVPASRIYSNVGHLGLASGCNDWYLMVCRQNISLLSLYSFAPFPPQYDSVIKNDIWLYRRQSRLLSQAINAVLMSRAFLCIGYEH